VRLRVDAAGAASVSAYVAHAAFPGDSYKRFCRGGKSLTNAALAANCTDCQTIEASARVLFTHGCSALAGDRCVFEHFYVTNRFRPIARQSTCIVTLRRAGRLPPTLLHEAEYAD
jgi:hypothetical protein